MKNIFGTAWSALKTGTSRAWKYAMGHKIIAGIVIIILIGGGYYAYTALAAGATGTEYVLGAVSSGPLQVTVTGSGQVSADNDLNLSPQASAQILKINVTPGEQVKAGTVVAVLDTTTADQAVESAKQNLESAQISYQQELSSSNTTISSDQTTAQNAQSTENTDIATLYTDIAPVESGLDTDLHSISTITSYRAFENIDAYEQIVDTPTTKQYHDQVVSDFNAAQIAYQKMQQEYASVNTSSLTIAQTESLAEDAIADAKIIDTALDDTLTYYNYVNQEIETGNISVDTQLTSQIATITGYQNTVSNDITSLTNANTQLINDEQTLQNDTASLSDSSGDTPLNVQTAELNVEKAQTALDQAETNESDYIVTAPFDGTIASVPATLYSQASSGTTVATLITNEEYASLSLNEADAAKVQVGQPVSLTFNALPNVTMQGTVAQINQVGTISSGVVTYQVNVSFNTTNSSIKPGMTVEATIVTSSVANAVQVPSAAVTTTGNYSYVQVATFKVATSTVMNQSGTGTATGTRRTRTASSTSAYGGYGEFASSTSGAERGGFSSSTSASTSVAVTTPMTTRSITVPATEVSITRVPVTVGISNTTMTQIVSGLHVGQYVVTSTQTAASKTTKSTAASATSLLGGSSGATRSFSGGGGGYAGGGAGGGRGG